MTQNQKTILTLWNDNESAYELFAPCSYVDIAKRRCGGAYLSWNVDNGEEGFFISDTFSELEVY